MFIKTNVITNLFSCAERSILIYSNFHSEAMAELKKLISSNMLTKEQLIVINGFIEVSSEVNEEVRKFKLFGIDINLNKLKSDLLNYKFNIEEIIKNDLVKVA